MDTTKEVPSNFAKNLIKTAERLNSKTLINIDRLEKRIQLQILFILMKKNGTIRRGEEIKKCRNLKILRGLCK